MKMLAGQFRPIEMAPMMVSILKMILAPVVAGVLVSRYLHRFAAWASKWLPGVSMWGICTVIAITIALSRDDLVAVAVPLLGAAVCHNATGFTLGYWSARALGLNRLDSRTVSIEVGVQNGGMATGLAFDVLQSGVAAVPSAVEGPWAAATGAGLASYWRQSHRPAEASRERASLRTCSHGPRPWPLICPPIQRGTSTSSTTWKRRCPIGPPDSVRQPVSLSFSASCRRSLQDGTAPMTGIWRS